MKKLRRGPGRASPPAVAKDDNSSAVQPRRNRPTEELKDQPEATKADEGLGEEEACLRAELAARIGLSVSAAKTRVQRARAMARAVIDRCCRFDIDPYGRVVDCHPRQCDCGTASK